MSLAERIRGRREYLGLTQADVARRFSITREAVQQWENGKTAPRGKRLRELCNLLQCGVHWLLTGQGERRAGSISADRLSAVLETLPERDQLIVMDLAESLAKRREEPSPPVDNNDPPATGSDEPGVQKKGARR